MKHVKFIQFHLFSSEGFSDDEISAENTNKENGMYYRLKEPYAFRGWKKLPYAICALKGPKMFERPFFFGKEIFLDMLYFNGQENVDPDSFSERLQTACLVGKTMPVK